jgi:hypothetical protein
MRLISLLLFLTLSVAALGCSRPGAPVRTSSPPFAQPEPPDAARVEAAGLHNVFRLTDNLYRGSAPEGDAGFVSLQKLRVKTIISVGGARPDEDRARKSGLSYVHLPIGYDGVPQQQGLRIARAARDLPGAVYIQSHHGKHRGPAAAAVVRLCLDRSPAARAALYHRPASAFWPAWNSWAPRF